MGSLEANASRVWSQVLFTNRRNGQRGKMKASVSFFVSVSPFIYISLLFTFLYYYTHNYYSSIVLLLLYFRPETILLDYV
jgi:hypothetical protein